MSVVKTIHISVPEAMASDIDALVSSGHARTRADFVRIAIYHEMDRIKALDVERAKYKV